MSARGGAAEAMLRRRSQPAVGVDAPSDEELLSLLQVAGTVADHSSLRPWRVIAIRGTAREGLGQAIAEATGVSGADAEKLAAKALRAPLLLALVVSPKPSSKVPDWEQEAVASGVGHTLSLLLDEAGWGVIWRTGHYTRSGPVHRFHQLAADERLLGWLYVGSAVKKKSSPRSTVPAKKHLSSL